jgi:hypothetical protein
MNLRILDPRGSALPAAMFLAAMVALVGASLHLAVQTEQRLAVNCLESDRARFAACSAARRRTAELRQALARFRLPGVVSETDAGRYRDDLLSGEPGRCLSLLQDGIPGLLNLFGPWTLDLPLDGFPLEPLDQLADCRAACHIEPLEVSGSPASGLLFSYRCRVTGEGRSSAPSRQGVAAWYREDRLFTILLARFPRCHWQLCLPAGGEQAGDLQLLLPPLCYTGPVRGSGRPGFAGSGQPLSGLPIFPAGYFTPLDDPSDWVLVLAADPQFAGGSPRRLDPPPLLPPPGDLARGALGLPPGAGAVLEEDELLEALGLPPGSGSPPPGVHVLRDGDLAGGIFVQGDLALLELRGDADQQLLVLEPAAGPTRMEIRVDYAQQTTFVDGTGYPGVLNGTLYVEGSILSLGSGSAAGDPVPPALAQDAALTVAASGDIVITGHLLYAASPEPFPPPRTAPPVDGRILGLYSAGCRADGSAAGGRGIVFSGPAGGCLCLDAALAVGGEGRGIRCAGSGADVGTRLFGALSVDDQVQPEVLSLVTVTYDPRFFTAGFHPPHWPAGPEFEACLAGWELRQREELCPYD